MNENSATANERFKHRARHWQWIAGGLAIAAHALVLLFTPPFTVEADSGSRMVIALTEWREPASRASVSSNHVAVDSTMPQPVLRNRPAVNHRIPRVYPWIMWHHREPSSVLLQLTVTRSGRPRDIRLLERSDNAAEDALLELVYLMRFEPLDLPSGIIGLVGTVEVGVVDP